MAKSDRQPALRLSRRERQVVVGLARGLRCPEVSEELGLSYPTVRFYTQRLREKLGAHSHAQIVAVALCQELVGFSEILGHGMESSNT